MDRKLPRANVRIARIEVNNFGRCPAVGRFSAWDDRASVITFVDVNVVVAQAGRIGATDGNAGFETGPISLCAG